MAINYLVWFLRTNREGGMAQDKGGRHQIRIFTVLPEAEPCDCWGACEFLSIRLNGALVETAFGRTV